MKNRIVSLIVSIIMIMSIMGCKHDSCGNNKPVAPDTYSSEKGDVTEPSLPYMKPWWKD